MRKGKGTKSSESLFLLPMKEKQEPYCLLLCRDCPEELLKKY